MSYTIEIEDIPITITVWEKRWMSLLFHYQDKYIALRVPHTKSQDYIKAYLTRPNRIEKIKAFAGNVLRIPKYIPEPFDESFPSTVNVWDIPCDIEIIECKSKPKIELTGNLLKMYIRPGFTIIQKFNLLHKFYKSIVKEAAPSIVKKWEEIMNVQIQELCIKKVKYHGYCTIQKLVSDSYPVHIIITLSSNLAMHSLDYLEVVIVHELCHVKLYNENRTDGHGKNFLDLMDGYLPDWKTISKKVNKGGVCWWETPKAVKK